jgi:hypothetical protein
MYVAETGSLHHRLWVVMGETHGTTAPKVSLDKFYGNLGGEVYILFWTTQSGRTAQSDT